MVNHRTRRELLAGVAAASALGAAGCLGSRESLPPPQSDFGDVEDRWRQIDQYVGLAGEDRVGPVTLRTYEHRLVYEHVPMRRSLSELFTTVEGSPFIAFFSRLDLRPGVDRLPFGIGHERVMTEVRPAANTAFREELSLSGITDVRQQGEGTVTVETGHTATTTDYRAKFVVDQPVVLPDGTTEATSGVLALAARLAVWHDGQDVLVAGGVWPAEPVAEAIKAAVPDDVTLPEDPVADEPLTTEPAEFAEAIETLIVTTE